MLAINTRFQAKLALWTGCAIAVTMSTGCNDASKLPAKNVQTYNNDAGELESITYMGHAVRDSDLERLASDTTLKELLIQECDQITDEGFSAVNGAKELVSLRLQHVSISDKALEALKGFTALTDLQIVNTQITGSGLAYLADSPVMELRLHGDSLTAEGLAGLSALDQMKTLTLLTSSANIGDVPAFGSLQSLEVFDGSRATVGPNGLGVLSGLTNLRQLMLSSADITDKDIDALNTLVNLEELHLLQNNISNAGFARLQLPKLKTLIMTGCTTMTDAGLGNLTGLPQLETLNLQLAPGIKGKNLTDLAALKNLKRFEMTAAFFEGERSSIDELKVLLPELQVSLGGD